LDVWTFGILDIQIPKNLNIQKSVSLIPKVIQNSTFKIKILLFANQLLKKESVFLLPLHQILKI